MTHKITQIEGDLTDLVNQSFKNHRHAGFIQVDGFVLTENYRRFSDAIENFEIRHEDVWLCGFPKTGTTWAQEMIWCIANNLDFEQAKVSLHMRFPFFELSSLVDFSLVTQQKPGYALNERETDSISWVKNLPSPRFIKSHLPFNLLPRQLRMGEKKPKIICVTRNPKDTCISYFHYSKLFHGFGGSFEDFCTLFIGDRVIYAPFWKHVLSFWEKENAENVLLLQYEDMKTDLPSVIRKTATFLGTNLSTDQISTLTEHLSFASMKANPTVNNKNVIARVKELMNFKEEFDFMRSGNVNQWKTDMSTELIDRFDDWTSENLERKSTHTM